jgi:peptidoglycan L-alanyl-D-glutamate endopeptidase CwlK
MSNDLTHLHPDLLGKCQGFLAACREAKLDVRITFTFRTPAEQNALYALGRTKKSHIGVNSARPLGRPVTSLTGARSKHCHVENGKPAALAFDFGVFNANGTYVQDGGDSRYLKAAQIGESLGLVSGIRWKSPFDPGHLELQ